MSREKAGRRSVVSTWAPAHQVEACFCPWSRLAGLLGALRPPEGGSEEAGTSGWMLPSRSLPWCSFVFMCH